MAARGPWLSTAVTPLGGAVASIIGLLVGVGVGAVVIAVSLWQRWRGLQAKR